MAKASPMGNYSDRESTWDFVCLVRFLTVTGSPRGTLFAWLNSQGQGTRVGICLLFEFDRDREPSWDFVCLYLFV